MRGQRDFSCAHCPDVQVVHFGHPWSAFQKLFDCGGINFGGHGVHRQIDRFAQQPPGAKEDDDGDHETGDRIDPKPRCHKDGDASDDYSQRQQRVGGHVQVGTADVQVAVASFHEQHRGGCVDNDANESDSNHDRCGDFVWIRQPKDCFPCDSANSDQQQQSIEQRRQNGRTAPSIRAFWARRDPGQRVSTPRHQ